MVGRHVVPNIWKFIKSDLNVGGPMYATETSAIAMLTLLTILLVNRRSLLSDHAQLYVLPRSVADYKC